MTFILLLSYYYFSRTEWTMRMYSLFMIFSSCDYCCVCRRFHKYLLKILSQFFHYTFRFHELLTSSFQFEKQSKIKNVLKPTFTSGFLSGFRLLLSLIFLVVIKFQFIVLRSEWYINHAFSSIEILIYTVITHRIFSFWLICLTFSSLEIFTFA